MEGQQPFLFTPVHKGEDLGSGITDRILKDVEVTKEEFINWYQKHM